MFDGSCRIVGATVLMIFMFQGCSQAPPVEQPLSFNHKKHVDNGLECADCHQHFASATFSGLPSTAVCMDCHDGDESQDPEMLKLLSFAANSENVPWKRVYGVADHVFYSHRRHIAVADLTCTECHGDMAQLTEPPAFPLVDQTMKWCIDCHEEKSVSTDCIHCHR